MEKTARGQLPSVDAEAFNLFGIPNETGSPERRLLLAILERAILDYVGNDPREIEEAQAWLFEVEEGFEPTAGSKTLFSFAWVCDQLDLDVRDISRKIKQMPKRGKFRIAPWHLIRGGKLKPQEATH